MAVYGVAASSAGPEANGVKASAFYEGSLRHRRHGALADELHHRLCLAYLDLDELPHLFDGRLLWSARRPAIAWFRRADYLGDRGTPLADAVRELVRERVAIELDGPIRLLTHVRQLGHCFNPVSFYYCFDSAGQRVRAVVAEVTNTPWRERHAYVMAVAEHAPGAVMGGVFAKALHVSPLLGMDHTYEWRLTEPRERLSVHITAAAGAGGEPVFDATLALRRREMTARALRRVLARHPAPTLRLTAQIYAHALRLRVRGASWHPHPDTARARA